ncbi:hypothetical protein QF000_004970 [Paraburkholderia atlantica]|uniref:DUF6538 domain-containing protein n=1 Tax=Paraburkholderia atlantica TaxID=2654982 RepID=UPI003D1BC2F0
MAGDFLLLSRHQTVYLFRRRVPRDLMERLGRTEIYRSLGTTDRKLAVVRARALATYTDQVFARIRAMDSNDDDSFQIDLTVAMRPGKDGLFELLFENVVPGDGPAMAEAMEAFRNTGSNRQTGPEDVPKLSSNTLTCARAETLMSSANALTLADGIKEYFSKADIKPTTRASYRTKLAYLVEQAGSGTPLFDIDQLRFVKLADTITDNDTWSDKTKSVYITIIGGFLNWHRIRAGLPQLTAATLKPKRAAPSALDRAAFTLDQLRTIFQHAARFRGEEPHKYWATVATTFLGCRVEELAQVNLISDLKHDPDTGVWYFEFEETPDADGVLRKSLKRHSSWRHAPIHSALVQHGFVD